MRKLVIVGMIVAGLLWAFAPWSGATNQVLEVPGAPYTSATVTVSGATGTGIASVPANLCTLSGTGGQRTKALVQVNAGTLGIYWNLDGSTNVASSDHVATAGDYILLSPLAWPKLRMVRTSGTSVPVKISCLQ